MGFCGFCIKRFIVFVVFAKRFVVRYRWVKRLVRGQGLLEERAFFGYGSIAKLKGAPVEVVSPFASLSSYHVLDSSMEMGDSVSEMHNVSQPLQTSSSVEIVSALVTVRCFDR